MFMAMGMSVKEYWYGDPYLAQSYYKRQKILNEQKNQELGSPVDPAGGGSLHPLGTLQKISAAL